MSPTSCQTAPPRTRRAEHSTPTPPNRKPGPFRPHCGRRCTRICTNGRGLAGSRAIFGGQLPRAEASRRRQPVLRRQPRRHQMAKERQRIELYAAQSVETRAAVSGACVNGGLPGGRYPIKLAHNASKALGITPNPTTASELIASVPRVRNCLAIGVCSRPSSKYMYQMTRR